MAEQDRGRGGRGIQGRHGQLSGAECAGGVAEQPDRTAQREYQVGGDRLFCDYWHQYAVFAVSASWYQQDEPPENVGQCFEGRHQSGPSGALGRMDARVALPKQRFLPALAEQLALWFPELGGRALAVSEISITKENVPTLPLVVVAFMKGTADPPLNAEMFDITEAFVIDFWLEPARYKKANGTETPFWSYYDYEAIRDTLLTNLVRWETPGGERIAFRELTVEAEAYMVTLTFRFTATYRWCPDYVEHGEPFKISFNLCTASDCCIPEEIDPCR